MLFLLVGWTCEGEHYTAMFLTFCEYVNKADLVREVFICCGVQDEVDGEDDIDFTAESMGDYIYDELQMLGLDLFEDVDFVVADSAPVNKRIVDLMNQKIMREKGAANAHTVGFINCMSHLLNLARVECFDEDPVNSVALKKVEGFMTATRTLKNRSKLRKRIKVKPCKRNVSRWESNRKVLKVYKKFIPVIPTCGFDAATLALVPTAADNQILDKILEDDNKFQSVSMVLQRGRNSKDGYCDMYNTRL